MFFGEDFSERNPYDSDLSPLHSLAKVDLKHIEILRVIRVLFPT